VSSGKERLPQLENVHEKLGVIPAMILANQNAQQISMLVPRQRDLIPVLYVARKRKSLWTFKVI
jgi:hypothetical protein